MSIREMIDRIDALAQKDVGAGAASQDIADLERDIGVHLPLRFALLARMQA
jgi:hypothetical protein